jgi:hypothetical protein
MAKAKKITPKEHRSDKYDEKLTTKGGVGEIIKVVKENKDDKEKPDTHNLDDYQELDERELGGEG